MSIAVVAYVFSAGALWAVITPIGGVPDEPAHITYAAGVVRGDLGAFAVVEHPNYPQLAVVTVPRWVSTITYPPRSETHWSYPCYATVVERGGDCAPQLSTSTTPTRVPTTVTRYPPPFYWLVGLPTLVLAGAPAVYAMRIVAAALAAGMIAIGLGVAAPTRRAWLALAAVVGFTPMVAQYAGSVNPSGLEISASLGLGVGLMGIAATRERRLAATVGVVALAFALAWARPRSYLALIAVIAAAIIMNWKELRVWATDRLTRFVVVTGTAAALVTAWLFGRWFTSPDPVLTGPAAAIRNSSDAVTGLTANLETLEHRFTEWGMHLVGRFGWLDHSPPRSVWIIWIATALGLALLAVWAASRWQRFALLTIAAGALIATPLFILTSVINANEYQARYHLTLAVLIVIATIAILSERRGAAREHTVALLERAVVYLPLLMLIAGAASIHRYSVGGEAQTLDVIALPLRAHTWLPPSVALGLAGAAVIIAEVSLFRTAHRLRPLRHLEPDSSAWTN